MLSCGKHYNLLKSTKECYYHLQSVLIWCSWIFYHPVKQLKRSVFVGYWKTLAIARVCSILLPVIIWCLAGYTLWILRWSTAIECSPWYLVHNNIAGRYLRRRPRWVTSADGKKAEEKKKARVWTGAWWGSQKLEMRKSREP